MRAAQVIPEPAATKVQAGEDVQVTFKAQFAPNLPRPGLVGVAVNGVYHTCTPGAPKPTATTKVWSMTWTPNTKCRLYLCLIEFIDWRYNQSC